MRYDSPCYAESVAALFICCCSPQTLRYKDLNFVKGLLGTAEDGTTNRGDTTTKTEPLPPLQISGLAVNRLRVTNSHRTENGDVKRWSDETWYSLDLEEIIRIGNEEDGIRL